ncbi:MAG: rRNA pseudouridine synthase [Gemmataceae bacterium]|nr:rRNA pseudouridine synthase [Gemmataceae bacterium]
MPKSPGQRTQLHRAMSKLGLGSRGQAWGWIVAGRVRVEGRVVRDPLAWVDLSQRITLDDEAPIPVLLALALHKPPGVVTTRKDERGRRTVFDLLPEGTPYLHAAGRLDADSEGLLVLTNDGALSSRLTDPERHVPKTYRLEVEGDPTEAVLEKLRRGVVLDDGPTRPAEARRLGAGVVELVLTEGRNRQARRMLQAVGHPVRRLVRTAIGGLLLGDLPPGGHRVVEDAARLFSKPGA